MVLFPEPSRRAPREALKEDRPEYMSIWKSQQDVIYFKSACVSLTERSHKDELEIRGDGGEVHLPILVLKRMRTFELDYKNFIDQSWIACID